MYIFTNGSILSHSTVGVREFVVILFIFLIIHRLSVGCITLSVFSVWQTYVCVFLWTKKRTGTGRSSPCFDWEFYLINILKLYIVLLSFIWYYSFFYYTPTIGWLYYPIWDLWCWKLWIEWKRSIVRPSPPPKKIKIKKTDHQLTILLGSSELSLHLPLQRLCRETQYNR